MSSPTFRPAIPAPPPSQRRLATSWRRSRSRCVAREHNVPHVKIYTKTGDTGETGLFGGGRVPKDDPRVSAYGDVDELNAAIGAGAAQEPRDFERPLLEGVQRHLFTIGAELATPDPAKLARALPGPVISEREVGDLEKAIDRLEAGLPPLKQFILPGGA